MSYQVLARKWRPRFFREMVGQEHVLKALINALDHNRLHQAYLFTGTRGVGKTTIARILAKCLNCEVGVSSEPCGQCSACQEINNGSFVDLIEIDAASHTGVDNMRAITDNAQYTPTKGRYKVYLIDEVHMLTTHSFNALLKTLEEPPEHAKFLLATTDPQKLPATVLSRCLQFHLKNMAPERIVSHLQYILERENVPGEEAALWSLARAAQGSMRDALSLTDQAIAFGQGQVLAADVSAMLGSIDQQTVYRLAGALIAHDAVQLLAIVADSSELSPDYAAILDALLYLLHRMTIAQLAPQAIDNSEGDREQVQQLAASVTADELQLFYQMGLLGKRDLHLAPDLRTGLEMALLRMLAFRPSAMTEPVAGIGLAATEPAPAKKPEAAGAVAPAAAAPAGEPPASPLTTSAAGEPAGFPAAGTADGQLPMAENHQDWLDLFSRLPLAGFLQAVAGECVLLSRAGDCWNFALDRSRVQLYNDRHAAQLGEVLAAFYGRPVRVNVVDQASELPTPAAFYQARKEARHQSALAALQQDETVQYFIEQYQAQIVPDSVTPLEKESEA